MHPRVLSKEERQANRQMRECAKNYIQLRLKTDNREPNDVDVNAYLDLRNQSYVMEYD